MCVGGGGVVVEIATKSREREGAREGRGAWRINNRPDLSKASLMGCDRNLFTLRLVLNQTEGEWQWQAAAGRGRRWVGRMRWRLPMRSVCVCVFVEGAGARPDPAL